MRRAAAAGALGLALLGVAAAPAPAAERGRLFANGVLSAATTDFSERRTFTLFAEPASLDASYRAARGPGFEVGIEYDVLRHLGLAVSFSRSSRDTTVAYSAEIPHPLYLDRPRHASGAAGGLGYQESVVAADLVVNGGSDRWRVAAFAGAGFFKVTADLVRELRFTQSYPYDTLTVTGVPAGSFTDSPVGFDLGAGLDYRVSGRFWLGAQARFDRATAAFSPSAGDRVEVDAGGFRVALGGRISF